MFAVHRNKRRGKLAMPCGCRGSHDLTSHFVPLLLIRRILIESLMRGAAAEPLESLLFRQNKR